MQRKCKIQIKIHISCHINLQQRLNVTQLIQYRVPKSQTQQLIPS
jgi:hypothetical protein